MLLNSDDIKEYQSNSWRTCWLWKCMAWEIKGYPGPGERMIF